MIHSRQIGTGFYTFILVVLIIISFFTFSEQFYPFLSSDMAVPVLMTPGFNIPGDLYFWGQDHSGAIVPMIARILCVTYLFPPLLAVSIVHFSILVLGYFALASLFKDRTLKIAFAFIWFFSCWPFLSHLLGNSGLQMSMLGISIWFLNKFSKSYAEIYRLTFLSASSICFIAAVWISDLASIAIPAFLITLFVSKRKSLMRELGDKKRTLILATSIFWTIIGFLFILYAKKHAAKTDPVSQIVNHPGELLGMTKYLVISIIQLFFFKTGNALSSIYFWFILTGVPVILVITNKKQDSSQPFTQQRWLLFFLVNGILSLVCLGLSHWVTVNGSGSRYFTVVYMSLWISLLLYIQANGSLHKKLRYLMLFFIIITGMLSSLSTLYLPDRIPAKAEKLNEMKKLGYCGIIADYQHAYLSSVVDPNRIKTTPHDQSVIRSPYLTSEVFKQSDIYVIKDGWLQTFPDTLKQFGHILARSGTPFQLAGSVLCRYTNQLYTRTFAWGDLNFTGTVVDDKDAGNGKAVTTTETMDKSKHFVFGPFIPLSPGKLIIRFRLKASENLSTDKLACLDISADYGKTILGSRTISASEFGRANTYQEFEIPIELTKRTEAIEFRILYLGTTRLTFDQVFVQGI